MVYMWANFYVNFRSRTSGNVAVVCISFFLFISLFVRIFFQFIDVYIDPPPSNKSITRQSMRNTTSSQKVMPSISQDIDINISESIEIVFGSNDNDE